MYSIAVEADSPSQVYQTGGLGVGLPASVLNSRHVFPSRACPGLRLHIRFGPVHKSFQLQEFDR